MAPGNGPCFDVQSRLVHYKPKVPLRSIEFDQHALNVERCYSRLNGIWYSIASGCDFNARIDKIYKQFRGACRKRTVSWTLLRFELSSQDMSRRYDVLSQEDFAAHRVRWEVRQQIVRLLDSPGTPSDRQQINVLDWGCGRGASVGKLLDQGFNAFGVEIDREVLQRGYPLLRERGYKPCEVIIHVEEAERFPDGFFHMIFSEEVLEHVEHIDDVAREMSRLTRPFGRSVHVFPGSRIVIEPHLFMPFVHWLPKSSRRQLMIAAFLLLGIGPKWPELEGKGIRKASEVYRWYLDEHTHYKDITLILEAFRGAGYEADSRITASKSNKWMPEYLRRNGFPGGSMTLTTSKQPA